MKKRLSIALSTAVVLISLVSSGWLSAHAVAQEATPSSGGFEIMPGVTAEAIAFIPGEEIPTLYRITIAPGVTYPFEPSPEISLIYGESGALDVTLDAPVTVFHAADVGQPGEVVDAGIQFRLEVGDYVVFPPLVDGEVSNAGSEPASVLVAAIMPLPVEVTDTATPIP